MAFFSVSGQLRAAAAQWVIAREAHHQGDRLQHQQKHGPENDVAVEPTQDMAQGHPPLIWLAQRTRGDQTQAQGRDRNPKGPAVKTMASEGWQEPSQQKRKGNGEEQAELSELLGGR